MIFTPMSDISSFDNDPIHTRLLIGVTNSLIEYRNQILESSEIIGTGDVLNWDDITWLKELDLQINEVIAYLED
jgi:hypothetical protein